MSKASDWAAAWPHLGDRNCPMVAVNEFGNIRFGSTRSYSPAEALVIAHWILDNVGESTP